MNKYILNDSGEPVIEPDLMKWAQWMETTDRRLGRVVAQEWIADSQVSTVFLARDANFSGEGAPVLWEKMVFNGRLNHAQTRCAGTREQAEAMHAEMVELVRADAASRTPAKP